MRFAVTNAKGEFTGTQYEAINDRIMAHHAQYGENKENKERCYNEN